MGHTLDVHNIHYRCTADAIERVEIAKILLLQDNAAVGQFANKTLDDIQINGKFNIIRACKKKSLVYRPRPRRFLAPRQKLFYFLSCSKAWEEIIFTSSFWIKYNSRHIFAEYSVVFYSMGFGV